METCTSSARLWPADLRRTWQCTCLLVSQHFCTRRGFWTNLCQEPLDNWQWLYRSSHTFLGWFCPFKQGSILCFVANGERVPMYGPGKIIVQQWSQGQCFQPVTLKEVWYIPQAAHRLLFVLILTTQDYCCGITHKNPGFGMQVETWWYRQLLYLQITTFIGFSLTRLLQWVVLSPLLHGMILIIYGIIVLDICPGMCYVKLCLKFQICPLSLCHLPLLPAKDVLWERCMITFMLLWINRPLDH